jgi:APA family basic amino acid/polyamine antiporter
MNSSPAVRKPLFLKKSLGLFLLSGVLIGQTIGAGIFALTPIAVGMSGPALPLAFLIAVVPIVFVMLALAMLGASLPTTGGTYRYGAYLFSPTLCFTGIWGYIFGAFLGAFPLFALTGANYLKSLLPETPVLPVALGLLFFFYFINLFGIQLAATVQAALVVILLSALGLYGFSGIGAICLENLSPFFVMGFAGLIPAACLLTFTFLGANAVIELGGEIKNPRRNIPAAIFLCLSTVLMIYLLVAIVTVGVLPYTEIAQQPLTIVAEKFLSYPAFVYFVLGGAFLAVVTTLNATYIWGTKSLLVMGADRIFPESLAAVNKRFSTPHWFLTIIWALSSFFLLLIGEKHMEIFALFAALGGIVIFIPVMMAVLNLKKRLPDVYQSSSFPLKGFLFYFCPISGIFLSIIIMVVLLSEIFAHHPFYFVAFLLWLILGVVYFQLRLRSLKRRGISPYPDKSSLSIQHFEG